LPLFEAVEFGGVLRMLPCRMQESMELDKLSSYSASAGCRLPVEVMSLILALLFRKTMGWKLVWCLAWHSASCSVEDLSTGECFSSDNSGLRGIPDDWLSSRAGLISALWDGLRQPWPYYLDPEPGEWFE
jgi:hypothetical protein